MNLRGVCVCVWTWPPVEGGCPLTQYQLQVKFTPPQRLHCHTPSDFACQFPPGENVNWWVSLGNVDRTVTVNSLRHSMVTFWCPARHVTLWHLGAGSHNLPFLPLQISKEYVPHVVSVTICSTTPILHQVGWQLQGSHLHGIRLCDAGHTSRRWAHSGTKYRNCIGLAGWPSCAMNLIHDLLLSHDVGMEKYRCFLGTTHENCCSLNTRNVKDKRQSGVVLSPQGGGFEPRSSATYNVT